ncbi:MAG: IS1595 family transposase, partial [Deltaproteobacteria bacterium]|nr:IS1595 family transposase [Deltaproteobacteria bacterium]
RFRGMSPKTFYLHLKECEFRFNYRGNDLGKMILRLLRNQPLKLS